jgi:molybdopterin synthase catalytic subunit
MLKDGLTLMMSHPEISIQHQDFDMAQEYHTLRGPKTNGAIVMFVGLVRELYALDQHTLWLEHYPDMTYRVLNTLIERVRQRWPIDSVRIVHRIGELAPGDQIVLVAVSAEHRPQAFAACECLMDHLKTMAPFWKREGTQWVATKSCDFEAAKAWGLFSDQELR